MTAPITQVTIDGTALDLGQFEYQVNVMHGRSDIRSTPEASTAQVILRGGIGPTLTPGLPMTIRAYGVPRFTGQVSDLSITHLATNPPTAVTTITGMGNLSKLGLRLTGEGGYPEDTIRERATTILDDSGLTYLNGGTEDLTLDNVSTGNAVIQTCRDGLQELAEWSGSTFFDNPAGLIIFESYGIRGITGFPGIWAAQTGTWAAYDQAWDTFPSAFGTYAVPSDGVIFTPTWRMDLQNVINDVTVTHGISAPHPDQNEDAASIALYGRRSYELVTGLKDHADADARGLAILSSQANPLWSLGQISVMMQQLDSGDLGEMLALQNGSRVAVQNLPGPAPFVQFIGIVEGWSETYVPGQHTLTLSISDPRYSYQTVAWGGVDVALTWADVDTAIQWYNVITSADLAA